MSFNIVRPAVQPPPVLAERRFQPTHLDFTRTQLINIFQQQALAYNCSPCCMLQYDREIRGPNAFLTLLPPEKHVEFVTRFQVYNNFSWVDAESLTMDIFKGQPTGTSSTRNNNNLTDETINDKSITNKPITPININKQLSCTQQCNQMCNDKTNTFKQLMLKHGCNIKVKQINRCN